MDTALVKSVAHLARLHLAEAEAVVLAQQLSSILGYIDQLQELATDGVEPLAHPLALHTILREDEPNSSLTADEALLNAPSRIGDFFGVPAVFDHSSS